MRVDPYCSGCRSYAAPPPNFPPPRPVSYAPSHARSHAPSHTPSHAPPPSNYSRAASSHATSHVAPPSRAPSHYPPPPSPPSEGIWFPVGHEQQINVQTTAHTRPTSNGGYVYRSHTTITRSNPSSPTSPRFPPPGNYIDGPPPSHVSRAPSYASGAPLQTGYPLLMDRPRSVAPSQASQRTIRAPVAPPPRSQSVAPSQQSRHAPTTPGSRYYPPQSARGRPPPVMPPQGFVLGEVESRAPSRAGSRAPSTVGPESSVSNWSRNVAKAAQKRSSSRRR